MMSVVVSEEDRKLAEQSGLAAIQIAWCRKDAEEAVIGLIARDEPNLEYKRSQTVPRMDRDFGHTIGTIIWEQTCNAMSSYFSKDLEERNKAWCIEGEAPYVLFSEMGDGTTEAIY
jgi:hypothetical protein